MNKIEFGDCRDTMRRWAADGVRAQMCVVMPMEDSAAAAKRRKQLASLHNLVPLHPRQNGNYQLPK